MKKLLQVKFNFKLSDIPLGYASSSFKVIKILRRTLDSTYFHLLVILGGHEHNHYYFCNVTQVRPLSNKQKISRSPSFFFPIKKMLLGPGPQPGGKPANSPPEIFENMFSC